jgi:hypothetical protein
MPPMPLFYFDVRDGDKFTVDEQGQNFNAGRDRATPLSPSSPIRAWLAVVMAIAVAAVWVVAKPPN